MKTIQSKCNQTLATLAVLLVLLGAVQLEAATFTATNTANWNLATTWTNAAGVNGIPTNTDTAIIPSGKTVTVATTGSYCTNAGQFISVSGTLKYSAASTIFGDITINAGGTLDTTLNGTGWTFIGSVTNNGAMTFSGGGSTITTTYKGGSTGSPKFLSGNITNSAASITGVYVNTGFFLTGQGGNQVTGISGGGALTNLSTISYGGNATPSITTLNCAAPGNLYYFRGGSGNSSAVYGTTYWDFTFDSGLQGNFPSFNAGAVFNGMFTDNYGGNGGTLPANFAVGAFTMGSLRANNDNIASSATMYLTGAGGWIYNLNKLTFNSGCTVYFTNGASGPIGGSVITPFVNVFIGSNAVVSLTNLSTVSGTLTVTNGGTLNLTAAATGSGAFTLRAAGTLGIANASGISSTASSGSMQLSGTRLYSAGANYAYNGTAAQVTGNQLTNTINTLTVSNAAGVTLSGGVSVTNSLIITAGTLDLAANAVTLGAGASVVSSGLLKGSLTMGATGKVYAGTDGGFGTNTVGTNLTMTSGSTINMDLGTTAAGANDLLAVSNTLTLNSTVFNLKAPSAGATIDQANDYVLVTNASGGITGTPSLNWVVAPISSANYSLVTTPNAIKLHYALPVAVSFLPFTTQPPATTNAGGAFTVVVQLQDSGNAPITSGAITTLSISNNATTFNSGSTSVLSDGSGNATFSGLSFATPGTYYLQVVAGSPAVTNFSTAFTITPGTPATLAIQTQPSTTANAGVTFTNQPVITVLDAFGNATTSNAVVTATASAGNLQGTVAVTADNSGVATFSGLYLTNTGNITLTFSATGMTSTNSSAISVSPGAATQLAIAAQPSSTAFAGTAFGTQPVITVADQYGNPTTSNAVVTATVNGGGVTLLGTSTLTATGGTVAFTNLFVTNTGSITLNFASTGLTSTNSSSIAVGGGTVTALQWVVQPGAAAYGVAFGQQPQIQTVDQYGNFSTNGLLSTATLTLTIPAGAGTLGGTTSYNIGTGGSNGVVTFSDLKITGGSGAGKQITATVPGIYGSPVPGMKVWLDANTPSSVLTNASGVVTNWQDLSGNGNHFGITLSNGGNGRIWYTNVNTALNGRRTVTFFTNTLKNTSFTHTGSNLTLFAVFKKSISGNSGITFQRVGATYDGTHNDYQSSGSFNLDLDNGTTHQRVVRNEGGPNGTGFTSGGDFSGFTESGGGFSTNYWVEGYTATTGSNVVYMNGLSQSTNTPGSAFNIQATAIGGGLNASGGWNSAFNGDIAEFIIYTNALTATDLQTVVNYLKNKWVKPTIADLTAASTAFTVTQAMASVTSGVTVNNKVYDTTTAATLSTNGVTLSGIVSPDSVTLTTNGYVANFGASDVNNGVGVTVSGLGLAPASGVATNYTLTQPTGLAANITRASVTVTSGITADNKVYDAGTTATLSAGSVVLSGVYVADSSDVSLVTNGYTATFASAGPANGITVTVNGLTLAGTKAGDYSLTQPTGLTANITPSSVDVLVTSSLNPSGYHDSVIFTATNSSGPSTPTGSIQFKTNGVAFGSTVTVNGSGLALSAATINLPRGTNTVDAEFSGTGAYAGVFGTNSLLQVVTNHVPVPALATFTRANNTMLKIRLTDLFTNVTDVDGDTLTLDSIDLMSTNGATITTNGTFIFYTNSVDTNVNDQLTYTVNDGYGGTATGYIAITPVGGQIGQTNAVVALTNDVATVTFFGVPGTAYQAQRATNVDFTGTIRTWDTNAPSGPPLGVFQIEDDFNDLGGPPAPPQAYYRLLVP